MLKSLVLKSYFKISSSQKYVPTDILHSERRRIRTPGPLSHAVMIATQESLHIIIEWGSMCVCWGVCGSVCGW